MGEPCTIYLRGLSGGVAVNAVFSRIPQSVGDLGAWEDVPAVEVRASDVPWAPAKYDLIIDASGARWIVDHHEEQDGMHRLTLRADTAQ